MAPVKRRKTVRPKTTEEFSPFLRLPPEIRSMVADNVSKRPRRNDKISRPKLRLEVCQMARKASHESLDDLTPPRDHVGGIHHSLPTDRPLSRSSAFTAPSND